MSKTLAATPAKPSEFTMPAVEVGQVVLWSYGKGGATAAAVVTRVATRSCTLSVHVDGIRDHITKNGVRHCDDPFLQTHAILDDGVWDLTPRDKRINALLESFSGSLGEE